MMMVYDEEGYEVTSCCGAELGERTAIERDGHITIYNAIPCCTNCLEGLDE